MGDDRGDGGWRARAVGVGHGASVCGQVRRSVYDGVEGVRVVVISFMAVGSLAQAIHSVEGASLPPGASSECLADCPSSGRLARSKACIRLPEAGVARLME